MPTKQRLLATRGPELYMYQGADEMQQCLPSVKSSSRFTSLINWCMPSRIVVITYDFCMALLKTGGCFCWSYN